jgi:hypothetical protein
VRLIGIDLDLVRCRLLAQQRLDGIGVGDRNDGIHPAVQDQRRRQPGIAGDGALRQRAEIVHQRLDPRVRARDRKAEGGAERDADDPDPVRIGTRML